MSVHSVARLRTHSFGAVLLTVVGLLTLAAAPAAVAAGPTAPAPTAGPTTGGTTVTVPTPGAFISSAASDESAYALTSGGQVWAWGWNKYGQVGDGTTTDRSAPVLLTTGADGNPLPSFKAIAAGGGGTAYALTADGSVYAWGLNDRGQVGNGTTTNQSMPVKLVSDAGSQRLPPFIAIAASNANGYGLTADGVVWGWGWNSSGNLGIGTMDNTNYPWPVPVTRSAPGQAPLPAFTSIAATGYGFVLAMTADGQVWAWGSDYFGVIGTGTTGAPLPTRIATAWNGAPLPPMKGVAGGSISALALADDGTVWLWGYPYSGCQFGAAGRNGCAPTQVLGQNGQPIVMAKLMTGDGGQGNFYGIDANGNIWSWGGGGGSSILSALPQWGDTPAMLTLGASGPLPKFQSVSSATYFASAIDTAGNLWVWGNGSYGRTGTGQVFVRTPTQLNFSVVVTSVTFGGVAGTTPVQAADGSWTTVTPPACGTVDVVVGYTVAGVPQPPLTYPDGFTYGSAPSFTSVTSSTSGGTFTGSVVVTGDDTPTIQWQSSSDGVTWTNLAGQTSATLTVPNAGAGTKYRVQATNCFASRSSGVLAADAPFVNPTPSPSSTPVDPPVTPLVAPQAQAPAHVSQTGGSPASFGPYTWLAVACLASGSALFAMSLIRRRALAA